ncbi:MAG: Uma2 family endonuclease [Bacteroidota bacterium]
MTAVTTAVIKPTISSAFMETIQNLGGTFQIEGVSKEGFLQLCTDYPDLIFEREANGMLILLMPIFAASGIRENKLQTYVRIWQMKTNQGEVFSSSTGFELPDGAMKSPDVAWVNSEKMEQFTPQEIEGTFLAVVPDFVIELRSKTDQLSKVKEKMQKVWIENGVRLGWLIDPYEEKAYVYRENGSIEVVENFDGSLLGEEVLPDFELKLGEFKVLQ